MSHYSHFSQQKKTLRHNFIYKFLKKSLPTLIKVAGILQMATAIKDLQDTTFNYFQVVNSHGCQEISLSFERLLRSLGLLSSNLQLFRWSRNFMFLWNQEVHRSAQRSIWKLHWTKLIIFTSAQPFSCKSSWCYSRVYVLMSQLTFFN
jgi:hypothetical protein